MPLTLREQFTAAVKAARAEAEAAARVKTPEARQVARNAIQYAWDLQDRLDAAAADEKSLDALNRLGGTAPVYDGSAPLVKSLQTLHQAAASGQVAAVNVRVKDLLSPPVPPTVRLPVVPGDYPTTLVDLSAAWAQQAMPGPSMRVYRVSQTATAGVVAEGATKPLSGLQTDHDDLAAQKWAVRESLTTEALADFPTLAGVVQAELSQALRAAVNGYVIATVTAAGTGAQTLSNPSLLDGVSAGKAQLLATVGRAPEQVWVNPGDLSAAETAKSAGSGDYFLPPIAPSPTGIHDVPVAATPAVPAGTWVLGSFSTAGVFGWRENAAVQMGYATGDVEDNKRSLIVESRGVLGIVRAAHLIVGTIA